MTSAKRLDQVLATQKACDLLEEVRNDFLYRADLMLDSATCVLSYPKLSPELRSRVSELQRLLTLAIEEVNRLEAIHRNTINAYAFDSCGLRPGMMIRPAGKARDRRVAVSRFSIGEDGVLTASGWRVSSINRADGNRRWDSVKLAEGLWRIEESDAPPAVPPEQPSHPRSRHDKTWGMLVDSTGIGSRDKVSAMRDQIRAIEAIQAALDDLTQDIAWCSTDHLLKYREPAKIDSVFAALEPFPALSQTLRAVNVFADGIQDDADWGACLYRQKELANLDLLTALYGIRAGDRLSVRYPNSKQPEVWHTVVVAKAWETPRGRKGEMSIQGHTLRKDGSVGKREDYVWLIPYEVEWRLHDPMREAEARHSKYGDAKWYTQPPVVKYDTPTEELQAAGERFIEFCRGLLFDAGGLFPEGIPIAVVLLEEQRWKADWAYWRPTGGDLWGHGTQGIKVTASHLGYAVGNRKKQAAVLLAAGLHQIAKGRYGYWSHEAQRRAGGMIWAIASIFPDLKNPYHHSTNEMLPESVLSRAEDDDDELGRRFTDEDLVRWVVRDVAESFRTNSLVFMLDTWMKKESREHGGRGQLVGRSRL
jgi:hypothetical protein